MNRVVIAAIALLISLLTACTEPEGPEQAIRNQISGMETALAERSPLDFMDTLSESFLGGKAGQLDKDKEAAKKMLAVYFLRYHRISIAVTQVEVEIDPYEPLLATASARVALAGGESLLPNSAGFYQVESQWRLFDGDWKITRLQWQ